MNNIRSPAPMLNNLVTRVNNAMNTANTRVNNMISNASVANSSTAGSRIMSFLPTILGIAVLVTVVSLFAVYWQNIKDGWNSYFGKAEEAKPEPEPEPSEENGSSSIAALSHIVEKALPERRQVYNISSNRYTYYDAEPLCKALGAELATYDQVKDAYENGADWCNYGWTQGQQALYPTQEATWLKLQKGPEEQRMSCGKPGINGGFFDNPELRFGVNCYGPKPGQKAHDTAVVSNGDDAPMTPEMIEFDKKVSKYRSIIDTVGIMPFKKDQWSA
jgi:hypothetical protein